MSIEFGKYIYCITNAKNTESFGNVGIGESNDEVISIVYKDIGAVVSNSPIVSYRVSRNNMMAHEKVIEKVMEKYTVLPVKFGTIAKEEQKISKILEDNYKKFSDMLKDIDDKKEIGVKSFFLEDVIFPYILEKYAEIAALKDSIAKKPPEKTHYLLTRIGEMVQNALEREKSIFRTKIMDALKGLSVKKVENKNYGDKMILNAAFLIYKKNEPEFDKIVNDIDKEYENIMKLKYVTCIPPFNFVNLEIKTF